MEQEKNIIKMVELDMKVNIQLEKKMEKAENIMIMVKYYLKVNI